TSDENSRGEMSCISYCDTICRKAALEPPAALPPSNADWAAGAAVLASEGLLDAIMLVNGDEMLLTAMVAALPKVRDYKVAILEAIDMPKPRRQPRSTF
ncbi:MAG TPA: hypothetical protein VIK18_12560, partial [Pirellulales bacterium]